MNHARLFALTSLVVGTFLAGLALAVLVAVPQTRASTEDTVIGFAWSENIGWISFNCTNNPGECLNSEYGVSADEDGDLSGYAWSENIGWISFQPTDVAGCPAGGSQCAPFLALSGPDEGKMFGWARVLAANPTEGWDGWIALNCESTSSCSPNYGVRRTSSSWNPDGWSGLRGYAWGSNVVGWISFNCTEDSSCGDTNYQVGAFVGVEPEVNPDLQLAVTSSFLRSINLEFGPMHANTKKFKVKRNQDGSDVYTFTREVTLSATPAEGSSGTYSDTGLTPNTEYFYVVSLIDDAGVEEPESNQVSATTKDPASLTSVESVDIKIRRSPSTTSYFEGPIAITKGQSVEITWTAAPATGITCKLNGVDVARTGTQIRKIDVTTNFVFTCTGEDGESKTDTVRVVATELKEI